MTQEFEVSNIPTITEKNSNHLSAISYLSVDVDSNMTLYEKNAEAPLPMASLTKIMTALLILENHDIREIATVPESAIYTVGSKIWLHARERISVYNLLKGLLIPSGNDAAIALAVFHSGSVEAFVDEMNERAKSLRMTNTQFQNPHGLHGDNHYSSSKDLLVLVRAAWKFPIFRKIVSKKNAEIYSLTNSLRKVKNTNKLLSDEIKGIKTGTTKEAGQCLLLYTEKDGHKVFTVVLGSINRYEDSQVFLDDIWKNIQW